MRVNAVRKLLWGLCGVLVVALVAAAWGAYRMVVREGVEEVGGGEQAVGMVDSGGSQGG